MVVFIAMYAILVNVPVSVHVSPLMETKNTPNPSHGRNTRLRSPTKRCHPDPDRCNRQTGHRILDNRSPCAFLLVSLALRLRLHDSSWHLPGRWIRCGEPLTGIEPMLTVYETVVLPLYDGGAVCNHTITPYKFCQEC